LIEADVIVIGAGISGLAAARALAAKGLSVRVVEARNRVGGRIHTVDGFDQGAHWVHGTEGNPLTNLARQLRLPIYFTGGDSSYPGGWSHMQFPGSQRIGSDLSLIAFDRVMDTIDAARDSFRPDTSLATAAEQAMDSLDLSAEDRALARWHLNLIAREDCAAEPNRLSAQRWDEGCEVYGYGDSIFLDGFGALPAKLAEGLDIAFDCRVSAIRYSKEAVVVETTKGHFQARQAIVTLPLGVLRAQQVLFDPPLPSKKTDAIARLGIGSLAKARLTFDIPFWPAGAYSFGFEGGSESHSASGVTTFAVDGRASIVIHYGGDNAKRFEGLEDDAALDDAMALLRREFRGRIPRPLGFDRTGWSTDPYALGSYCYMSVNSSSDDLATLAQPVVGTLFFAGEATSSHQWAYAHGAYLSGLREAAQITGDPSLLPSRNFTENRRWRAQLARASRFFNLRISEIEADKLAARTSLLAMSPTFAEVERGEIRLLATMFEELPIAQGDWLCRKGEAADRVFLIESGTLDVIDEKSGAALASLGQGALTGEYGLFQNAQRTASIRATSNCLVLALDYPRFTRFLNAFPQASLALLRQIVGRIAPS
jgi:monoamine oxidase